MKKVYISIVLLMLSIGGVAQEKLFREGYERGRTAKTFYYGRNTKSKGLTLDKVKDYASKHNYILGHYTTKEIERFGDSQTVLDQFNFIHKSEYDKFVFECAPYNNVNYDALRQMGDCLIYENGKFVKLSYVKWSGSLVNGMLDGRGTAFQNFPYSKTYYYMSGEFQKGLPLGDISILCFKVDDKDPENVSFSQIATLTVGKLSDNLAKFCEKSGKWGFVASDGTIAIPRNYDSVVKDFYNGKAEVVHNGKEILISKTGTNMGLTEKQKKLDAAEKLRKEQEKRNREIAQRQEQIANQRARDLAERNRKERIRNCKRGDRIIFHDFEGWLEGLIFKTSHGMSWDIICYVEENINNGERLKVIVGTIQTSGDRYVKPTVNGVEFRENTIHYIEPLYDEKWHME